jgi:hypothetical protein
MAHDFFLSYRRTDQPLARALAAALMSRGARVWWDDRIEAGKDWRDAIVSNLETSRSLVILFSEACNSSKQLRKELALADMMDKVIIPVLIEPTQPRGHFLYELAALNWVQIHPDPASKINDLADKLAADLDIPARRGQAALEEAPARRAIAEAGSSAPVTAPAPARQKAARKPAALRKVKPAKPATRRNFLAFKWYEVLVALLFACLPIIGFLQEPPPGRVQTILVLTLDYVMVVLVALILIAILVFPVRYYLRRLRARAALFYHLASVWCLSGLLGFLSAFHPEMLDENFGTGTNILLFVFVWGMITLGFSLIAFAIYGLLHFQRSLRQLKSNTEIIGAPA